MSHFAEIKLNALQKNEKDLIASLEEVFGEGSVEVYDTAVTLTGYDAAARKKAHIVVRKESFSRSKMHAYNDMGFERTDEGGYVMHYDDMDFNLDKRNSLMQDYATRVTTRKLKAQGYAVKRKVLENGSIELLAQRS